MSVCLTLFKCANIYSFNLDCILQKGDLLLKSLNSYRYLWIEDLPHKFFLEHLSVNVEYLKNGIGGITARAYLVSITETKGDCQ